LGQLLVQCGKCGSLYSSGIIAEFENVKRKVREFNKTYTICPFCRQQNLIEDAKLIIAPEY